MPKRRALLTGWYSRSRWRSSRPPILRNTPSDAQGAQLATLWPHARSAAAPTGWGNGGALMDSSLNHAAAAVETFDEQDAAQDGYEWRGRRGRGDQPRFDRPLMIAAATCLRLAGWAYGN